MKKLILVFLIGATLAAATPSHQEKILQLNIIPTSFNESIKSQVITDQGSYIIRGFFSFKIGDSVTIKQEELEGCQGKFISERLCYRDDCWNTTSFRN